MDTALWGRALAETEPIDRREKRAITRAVVIVIVLVLLATTLYWARLTRSGLHVDGGGGGAQIGATHVEVELNVTNHGLFTEHDTQVTVGEPGLRVISVRQRPEVLRAGESGILAVNLEVDCQTLPLDELRFDDGAIGGRRTPEPAVISTNRFWGRASSASEYAGYILITVAATACEAP